jgi:hypothetical protein
MAFNNNKSGSFQANSILPNKYQTNAAFAPSPAIKTDSFKTKNPYLNTIASLSSSKSNEKLNDHETPSINKEQGEEVKHSNTMKKSNTTAPIFKMNNPFLTNDYNKNASQSSKTGSSNTLDRVPKKALKSNLLPHSKI